MDEEMKTKIIQTILSRALPVLASYGINVGKDIKPTLSEFAAKGDQSTTKEEFIKCLKDTLLAKGEILTAEDKLKMEINEIINNALERYNDTWSLSHLSINNMIDKALIENNNRRGVV